MMASFQEACQMRDRLQTDMQAASEALNAFPKEGPMNLTPDAVKFSPEFQEASAQYRRAHDALRRFNLVFCKVFAKELRAERRARRDAMPRISKSA